MDVVSDKKVTRLVASQGKTRVYEMADGNWVTAQEGTVSWRNNNPGNLKFGFADSADKTVKTTRSKEKALEDAQHRYSGVVDLDHWGNAVFEDYAAGRAAQKQPITQSRRADQEVFDAGLQWCYPLRQSSEDNLRDRALGRSRSPWENRG
jgi:hypothetical protein